MKKPVTKVALSQIGFAGLEDRRLLSSMGMRIPNDHAPQFIEVARFRSADSFATGFGDAPIGRRMDHFAPDFAGHRLIQPPTFILIDLHEAVLIRPGGIMNPGFTTAPPAVTVTTDSDTGGTTQQSYSDQAQVPPSPPPAPGSFAPPVLRPELSQREPTSSAPVQTQIRAANTMSSPAASFASNDTATSPRAIAASTLTTPPRANRAEFLVQESAPAWHAPASASAENARGKSAAAESTVHQPGIATQPPSPAQGQSAPVALSPWESLSWWLARRSGSTVAAGSSSVASTQTSRRNVERTQSATPAMPVTQSPDQITPSQTLLFASLNNNAQPLASAELLQEKEVEDQSDVIQQSIDAILAQLTPSDIMQGTYRTSVGTSLGLAVATALTVEYLRRNQKAESSYSDSNALQKFKPECEESESID